MKVFISYGHKDHTALVDALFDALREDGHMPWKDDRYEGESGISAGEDFSRVIYDAILSSDLVLAFVTAQTQDRPYCCDERQYAYNHKGSKFIQLRMDGADIRLGNSRSYIDMDDAVDSTGKVDQLRLREKLKAVYAAFRDPTALISPSYKFEKYLKTQGALQYEDFVAMPERDDFVGRQWLKDTCKSWILDDTNPCRLFVVLGSAGAGKTAFVRHLAADRQLVRSVHVCIYDRPVTRNIRNTLKDLAYTLTTTNRAYHDYLKNKDFEQLDTLDSAGLFEFLFLTPLKNETEKYLLIIDGLDELEENTGLRPLIQVLRQYASRLNPNISILVTGRPDESIVSKLRTVSGVGKPVLLDRQTSREDLSTYIAANLQKLGCDTPQLREKLLEVCDGNFEYLALLFREARDEGLQLSGNMHLPGGLSERYTQYLDRRMEKCGRDESFDLFQRRLLSVLCMAYEPISVLLLSHLMKRDDDEILEELRIFGSLITKTKTPEGDTLLAFFSKGFRDYLLAGEFEQYAVSARKGTEILARYVMNCGSEAALKRDSYIDRHGFTHLLQYMERDPESVQEYLQDMADKNHDATDQRIVNALCTGQQQLISTYFSEYIPIHQQHEILRHLKGRRAVDSLAILAEHYRHMGQDWKADFLLGDVRMLTPTPERRAEAETKFEQALRSALQQYQKHPDVEIRRDLATIYLSLGKLASSKRTSDGQMQAIEWFVKMLEVSKENHREAPCYETRRSVAVVSEQLGILAKNSRTKVGGKDAEGWFREMLAINEEGYRENPCYRTRRDLALAFRRMSGLMANHPWHWQEAKEWFTKALELTNAYHRENPGYQSRNDLMRIYDRMGFLAEAQCTDEGRAEAEAWYRKELALAEENYREDPCYESRRSMGVSCERLGDLFFEANTPEGARLAEEWYRKKLELSEETYGENPCYESRRGLLLTYGRMGDVFRIMGTEDSWKTAEEWYRKALALAEENYREHPIPESGQTFAFYLRKMGALYGMQQTLEAQVEAALWYQKANNVQ